MFTDSKLKTGDFSKVFLPTAIAWNLPGFACIQLNENRSIGMFPSHCKNLMSLLKSGEWNDKNIVVWVIIKSTCFDEIKYVIYKNIKKKQHYMD